jgi:transcriptional regulator with XRE-family HTH domain
LEEENLVKKTCKELGITQKELAKKLGISDRTLSKYATNKIPKNIENHLKLIVENKKQKDVFKNLKSSILEVQNQIE